jgi:hypothetical protein
MARLGYARVSDDSVTSYHVPDEAEAIAEARAIAADPDVSSAWVRDDSDVDPGGWPVVWRSDDEA